MLTRSPSGQRRSPRDGRVLLERDLPFTRHPGAEALAGLTVELVRVGIAGGTVDDALAGAAARAHDLPLPSRVRCA